MEDTLTNLSTKRTSGKGLNKNSYKLNNKIMFGNLFINPDKLSQCKLEAYYDNEKVLSSKIDIVLHDLLTKRYGIKEFTVKSHWMLLVR